MGRRIVFFSALACLATLVMIVPRTSAEDYGQLRTLKRRAATIAKQKNSFIDRVLRSYAIPYQRTLEGIVARLQIEGRWVEVYRIEIVPVLSDSKDGLQVVAHDIFFFTESDVLHLLSAISIR